MNAIHVLRVTLYILKLARRTRRVFVLVIKNHQAATKRAKERSIPPDDVTVA